MKARDIEWLILACKIFARLKHRLAAARKQVIRLAVRFNARRHAFPYMI
jgi:hypothetical protein